MEKIFKFRQCIFTILSLSPFGKRRSPSSEQTGIPFTEGCVVWRFVEISPVVLEKKIFKFRQCIFAISLLFPLEKGRGPLFEQPCNWIPFTQVCFVSCLVEIALGQWIFNLISSMYVFSIFRYYLPLKKLTLHLNKLESP